MPALHLIPTQGNNTGMCYTGVVPMAMHAYACLAAVPTWGYALYEHHVHGYACMYSSFTHSGYYMHYAGTVPMAMHASLAAVPPRGYDTGTCAKCTGAVPMALHAWTAAVPTRGYCMHYTDAVPMAINACTAAVPTQGTVCTTRTLCQWPCTHA